jgi:hypothetical protein
VALQAQFVPVTATAPKVAAFGIGGEFRFTGGSVPTSAYVGIRATQKLIVDGIAETQSAAPVVGANVASGWLPTPTSNWQLHTSFVYVPAAACAAANLVAQPSNGSFAVLRQGKPAAMTLPAGAVQVSTMPMFSSGAHAVQQSTYTAVQSGSNPAGFNGTLAVGDCLIAYSTAAVEPTAKLDVENQSTIFLRR